MLGREEQLKIILLTLGLLGLSAVQPSLAKAAHGHHAHHGSSKAKPAARSGIAKGANSAGENPTATIDLGIIAPPPRSAFTSGKAREAKPSFKIAKPENYQAHRPEPTNPVTRNALGQPVVSPLRTTLDGKHFGVQTPPAVVAVPRAAVPGVAPHNPEIERQEYRSLASIPSRSRIDGAGLIRPSVAAFGLGGPAKTVNGINGTTLRAKH